MATPVLADLRAACPQAEITVMCRSPVCDLLTEDPHIDELFCFRHASLFSRREERRNIIEKLRKGKYDAGILLTHSFSSAWWFWIGNVKQRVGYRSSGRRVLLTHPLHFPAQLNQQHLVLTYKNLLKPFGISVSNTAPRLYLRDKEVIEAKEFLKEYHVPSEAVIVGMNPGATYGSAKCWLPERFREVAKRLLEDPAVVVLFFGDASTAPLVQELCQNFSSRVIPLAGKTSLRQLAALLSLCRLLLTNDSGPMHVADALGVPTIALFGSTSEIVTGPYCCGKVIHKHVQCSPCYQRVCPIDFRCMNQITSDEVYQAVRQELYGAKSNLVTLGSS